MRVVRSPCAWDVAVLHTCTRCTPARLGFVRQETLHSSLVLFSSSHFEVRLFHFGFLICWMGLISSTSVCLLWDVNEERSVKTFPVSSIHPVSPSHSSYPISRHRYFSLKVCVSWKYTYICRYMCMHLYACIYVCVDTHVLVQTHTHTFV